MRIGLISDTRIPGSATEVPPQVIRAFDGVDLILHAGGIQAGRVLDWLERIAPVKAVGRLQGRQFESSTPFTLESGDDPRVAEQQILQLEGHTIGMVNSLDLHHLSDDVNPGTIAAQRFPAGAISSMVESVFGTPVDIVVFGRTLVAMVEEHDGILFVNPGSPTIPRNYAKLGQVAILDLTPESRKARIIDLATLS
ncbi:MAG: YfcE family phosphodiesterase [Dehalococcoidia bacterium]|nr:YfcE family phosphodiesterase [Dehalococcoidia bacterium]